MASGCSHNNKDDYIKESLNVVSEIHEFENTIAFGVTDETAINDNQLIHKIKSNNDYSPEIIIKNNYDSSFKFRIFFLVDYKQISVMFKDKPVKTLDLQVSSRGTEKFEVKLPELQNGLHDFLVILVRDPDNTLEEEKFVPSAQVYMSRRIALIVDDKMDKPKHTVFPVAAKEIEQPSADPYITTEPFNPVKDAITLLPKKTKDLHLNIKNGKENSTYAILSFLGKEQISFSKPFVSVSSVGQFSLPFELNNNNQSIQNLIITVVEDPYTLNEDVMHNVYFSNIISTSDD